MRLDRIETVGQRHRPHEADAPQGVTGIRRHAVRECRAGDAAVVSWLEVEKRSQPMVLSVPAKPQ
jgi:hypothetical protein